MRGFLKSREGIFQLSSETTTIGREGCDLWLSDRDCSNCIHALIKYNATDASFTLHDINSLLGVYVNDCRIHNSAVTLQHNDLIRLLSFDALNSFYVELNSSGFCYIVLIYE